MTFKSIMMVINVMITIVIQPVVATTVVSVSMVMSGLVDSDRSGIRLQLYLYLRNRRWKRKLMPSVSVQVRSDQPSYM